MIELAVALVALARPDDPVEVGVSRTPGKPLALHQPGKPAEEVVAAKEGETFVLRVRVNVARDHAKAYTERTAELSPAEWAAIVSIVLREKLLEWKPEGPEAPAPDWGEMGLLVRGERKNAPTWIRPIRNGDGVGALAKKLAALAREKVKELPLFYLTP